MTVAADAADAYLQIRGSRRGSPSRRIRSTPTRVCWNSCRCGVARARSDESEVAQAEALLRQASATVPSLRIALEAQLNRLDVLMGAQPGTYARGTVAMPRRHPRHPDDRRRDQPLDVLRRRPDIIAAERHLAASNERIGVALVGLLPEDFALRRAGIRQHQPSHLFTRKAFQPRHGRAALAPVRLRQGRRRGEEARGANAEALAQYRQAVLKAAEDVEDAFMTLSQTERAAGVAG